MEKEKIIKKWRREKTNERPERQKIEEKIYELQAELCSALSHPRRLKILNLLRDGEKSVKQIVQEIKFHKANLSQHLNILKKQKIVTTRREGVNSFID